MASLSSSTNIGASSASSIRGYGGLASGLDRDSLIENMTAATRSKIAKQGQKKQTYLWQQEALRSISSPLVQLAEKYMSYTSQTNLSSASFWGSSSITSSGANSKYVTMTGSSAQAGNISILGVKNLAANASKKSVAAVSDNVLSTGDITIADTSRADGLKTDYVSQLEGSRLTFKYNGTTYNVNLGSGEGYDYSSAETAKSAFEKALSQVSIGGDKTLNEVIVVETTAKDGLDAEHHNFSLSIGLKEGDTSNLVITGGTQAALEALGVVEKGQSISEIDEANRTITEGNYFSLGDQSFFEPKNFVDRVSGKSMTFTYNGTSKSIILLDDDVTIKELKQVAEDGHKNTDANTNKNALAIVKKDLQTKLNKAFGEGRIFVDSKDGKLTFVTKKAGTGTGESAADDESSVLTISSGDSGVVGKNGALNVAYGESNHLNLSSSLADSGLNSISISKLQSAIDKLAAPSYNIDGTKKISELTNAIETYRTALGLNEEDIKQIKNAINLIKSSDDETVDNLKDKLKPLSAEETNLQSVIKKLIKNKNFNITTETTISDLKNAIKDNKTALGLKSDDAELLKNTIDNMESGGASKISDLNKILERGAMKLTINGQDIEGLTYSSSMSDIMNAINSSDAGVTVSYLSSTDKFSIIATVGGAGGQVQMDGRTQILFGMDGETAKGTDAVVTVRYNDSGEEVELSRGSNSFTLDGLTVSVSGEFGYIPKKDAEGNDTSELILDTSAEAVKFTSKPDTDKITSAVSSMIKDFNAMLELVNAQVSTKPNRDYAPLTDEQKKDMTDDQIKTWEEKAKAGVLFNDSDLRTLSDSLRFIIDSGSADKKILADYGISVSTDYADKGKLVFDENTFRKALEVDSETIKNAFTKTASTSADGTDGLMAKIKAVTDKYASTKGATKGILIERAGSTYAPTSVISNGIQKSIDSLEDYIKTLQGKLKTETDRYISQFTNLETLISQMNSQSSYLSSLSGS